jgi:hypothetical protein
VAGVVVAEGVAGAVVAPDGDVVAGGWLPWFVLLLDPHAAAPTPSTATQVTAATRRMTFLTVVPSCRFIWSSFWNVALRK